MYLRRHKMAARVENDLIKMQRDIASGLRVEFHVQPDVMGLVVGFRGENVRKVRVCPFAPVPAKAATVSGLFELP
jgi:hypothetical protein